MDGIDPKKDYVLLDLVKLGVMGRTNVTVVKNILEDKLFDDILKAEIGGTPKARRYKIKGSNLIKYLKKRDK